MRQDRANVNTLAIVMNSGHKSKFVTADIEHGQVIHLIRRWKDAPQLFQVGKLTFLDFSIPMQE